MYRLSDTELKQRIAQTYSGSDNWSRVQQYKKAIRWRTKHPKQGSYAASTALGLPRGRLRTWFDGGKPDPFYAIDTADSRGWIDTVPGERTFEGLSVIHAWVLAGGSIATSSFVPSLAIGTKDPVELAHEAFDAVGVTHQSVNESTSKRAHEIRPKGQGGSHLGRFLHGVLGAPIGGKTQIGADTLEFLESVPRTTLLRWCQTYVTLRGASLDSNRKKRTVRLGEQRSQEYRRALASLLRKAVNEDAHVTVTRRATFIGADTPDILDVVPSLPSDV